MVGGACVTEEFYPGFRNSTAAYTVSLLQPKIIRELRLHDHGLRVIERRAQNFLPLPDGRYLLMGEGRSEREIAKFSVKDAQRYPAYRDEIGKAASVVRSTMLNAPPNLRLDSVRQAWREIGSLFAIGKNLWKADALKAVFRLLRRSAGATTAPASPSAAKSARSSWSVAVLSGWFSRTGSQFGRGQSLPTSILSIYSRS